MIKKWFNERTFHHKQFSNISKLVKLKKEQDLFISLGLPTFNVEKSIGEIISVIKESLVEKYPLLDQIAIIDSHSSDATVSIAQELGVEIYFDDEVLTSMGTEQGKGEALWKSLHVLTGDIIVWIDSDIENIHPRFVYGLVGPLLYNPEIAFVKGFYQRPIREQGRLKETGGGRVTEILARPILNLFYPELACFIQPLSGEYAGRREVLESVPLYTGYAVEFGLLVEIWRQFGFMSMAQVDLEKRIHPNQPTRALGRMAFAIYQAVFQLLDEDNKIRLLTRLNKVLRTVKYREGTYTLVDNEIRIAKRPPINSVPEYTAYRKQLEMQVEVDP